MFISSVVPDQWYLTQITIDLQRRLVETWCELSNECISPRYCRGGSCGRSLRRAIMQRNGRYRPYRTELYESCHNSVSILLMRIVQEKRLNLSWQKRWTGRLELKKKGSESVTQIVLTERCGGLRVLWATLTRTATGAPWCSGDPLIADCQLGKGANPYQHVGIKNPMRLFIHQSLHAPAIFQGRFFWLYDFDVSLFETCPKWYLLLGKNDFRRRIWIFSQLDSGIWNSGILLPVNAGPELNFGTFSRN